MRDELIPIEIDSSDVFAEGETSASEAEKMMANLTKSDVGVRYDGPDGLEDHELVEPQEAAEVLNTALEYSSQMTPDEYTRNEVAMESLGFDNSTHGNGSVVQELVEGHGVQGADTPVYVIADFDEEAPEEIIGSQYAVVADELQTASTEEDCNARLTLSGSIAGEPESQEDIRDFARTVGGDLGPAYQTIADL